MKVQKTQIKTNLLKKIFIKICIININHNSVINESKIALIVLDNQLDAI